MDEKEKLYNALVERELYSKSFEEFDQQFSTPEKIGSLYSSLKDEGLVSIPQDSFQSKYFPQKPASNGDISGDQASSDTIVPENDKVPQNPNMEASEGNGFFGQVEEFANSILRSGVEGAGQMLEGASTFASQGAPLMALGAASGKIIGNEIEKTAQEIFPDNPEIQNTFWNTTVPQALGSTISYVGAGAAGGTPLVAISAGFQLGQTAFEEAKAEGKDDSTAMTAFLVNMPLGGIEAFPVSRFFSRLNKGTGGTLANVLKEGLVGGAEEAIQETAQQFFSNVAAINIYDDSRDLVEGVGEGGAAGFAVGLLLNSIGAKVGDMKNNPDLTAEEKAEVNKAETLVNQKKQELSEQESVQQSESEQGPTQQFEESVKIPDPFTQPPFAPPTETEITGQPPSGQRERGAFTTQKEKGKLSGEFKQEFQEKGERLYDPIPDSDTQKIAEDFVDRFGVRGAKEKVFDEAANLTMAQRVAVGQKILTDLDTEYTAKKESDPEAAEVVLDEQINFANRIYRYGTELGRGVRAFAYHSHWSPDAFTRIYEREVTQAQKQRGSAHPLSGMKKKVADVDPNIKKEIVKRVKAAKKKPEGFQREEAIMDVMAFISKHVPPTKTEIGISLAYANLLSGHETQIVNLGSTAINTLLETGTMVAGNPSLAPDAFMGLYRGFFKGMAEAQNVLKTGKIVGSRRKAKLDEIPVALERAQFSKHNPLQMWKYVRRVMAASDIMFFKAGEEARARMLAKSIAKNEGGTEAEVRARASEILGLSEAQVAQAREQAASEGLTPDMDQAMLTAQREGLSGSAQRSRARKIVNDFGRRVSEIAERQRPEKIREESIEFGLRSTFNNNPDGILGTIAKSINSLTNEVPAGKIIVPFTNVVANVTNRMLDYTPVGWTRLNQWSANSANPEFMSDKWKQQAAKAALGSMGMITVAMMNGMAAGEDDPDFEITGRGPDNFQHRYQLQETGWKPYSVKIGDTYYSYKETPLALAFGITANYFDGAKYGDISDQSLYERTIYALNAAPQTVMNQSFLTGLQDLFTTLSQEKAIASDNPLSGILRKGSAFGIPNAIKQIDRIFDPRVMTDDDIKEALIRDIPVARSKMGKPIINVLGDAIRKDYTLSERALRRFISNRKSDPIWRTIVEKRAWITNGKGTRVRQRDGSTRTMTPDEYYRFLQLSGTDIKRTLRLNLPKIKAMPEEQAQEFIRDIVQDHRSAAKERIQRGL